MIADGVTILVLVDSVLQYMTVCTNTSDDGVTILVLVDSVLQFEKIFHNNCEKLRHNPCFSGQCFAMLLNRGLIRGVSWSQSLF